MYLILDKQRCANNDTQEDDVYIDLNVIFQQLWCLYDNAADNDEHHTETEKQRGRNNYKHAGPRTVHLKDAEIWERGFEWNDEAENTATKDECHESFIK